MSTCADVRRVPSVGRVRAEGDRGSGTVAAITILFAFTFLSLVWLARDVDRGLSTQGAAEAIAFQSARSGAQEATVGALRSGEVTLDPAAARVAAITTASRLFASYGVEGRITTFELDAEAQRVRVVVRIDDGEVSATGVGVVTVVVTS